MSRVAPPSLALSLLLCCAFLGPTRPVCAGLPARPVEQWRWVGSEQAPQAPYCTASPVVAQLTDDDGDGDVDGDDVPDVAFLHAARATDNAPAWLTVVDGASGRIHFTLEADGIATPQLAAGDIDGDGVAELVSCDDRNVVVVEGDGSISRTLAWPGPPPNPVAAPGIRPIGLADLDQDGTVDLYRGVTDSRDGGLQLDAGVTAMSLDGAWSWTVVDRELYLAIVLRSVQAAELDPTRPGLELYDGDLLLDAQGGRVWRQRSVVPLGPTAVGDLDGDSVPELMIVSTGFQTRATTIHVLDTAGRRVAELPLDGVRAAGDVAVADGDGDGLQELFVPLPDAVRAYTLTGGSLVELWSAPTNDATCCAGLTAFDFDGDGAAEIVYNDEEELHFLDGASGASLARIPTHSETILEKPILADIDGDCATEIVVARGYDWVGPHSDLVVAFEVPGSVPARAIWNQSSYHVANVLDDGRIPVVEAPPGAGAAGWHAQTAADCPCSLLSNELPELVRACAGDAVLLDGSALRVACPGGPVFRWTDPSGNLLGEDPLLELVAEEDAALTLTVDCPSEPDCFHEASTLIRVESRPEVQVLSAAIGPCREGILLEWTAASWSSPAGGRYHLYRSEGPAASEADALSRPPVARDLALTSYHDRDTVPGRRYLHVVMAEEATPALACLPDGPSFGGATGHDAGAPVVAAEPTPFPDGVYSVLRIGHGGDELVARWPESRPLVPGEHYHLLRATDSPTLPFARVTEEGARGTEHRESLAGSWLHFYDLRVADRCERESLDEYPPG